MRLKTLLFAPILLGTLFTSSCKKSSNNDDDNSGGGNGGSGGGSVTWPQQPPLPDISGSSTIIWPADKNYVNVMGDFMPRMPKFPNVKKKAGKLCGYVADLEGNPLEGVYVGVSVLGNRSKSDRDITDKNGYYEITLSGGMTYVFSGSLRVYYGESQATTLLSLHSPNGGEIFDAGGDTRNFVVLSYGLADESRRVTEPHAASGYYGGSIVLSFRTYQDIWRDEGLPVGSVLEVKLTPIEGSTFYNEKKEFIIKKNIISEDDGGNFYINNIPIGQYTISAKLNDGRPIKMNERIGEHVDYPFHGLSPAGVFGSTKIFFTPKGKTDDGVPMGKGAWNSVDVLLKMK
jgi:hypothetical protein